MMKNFSFMKYYWLYFLISLVVLVPGIISLILYRVQPSIDFTGGSLIEISAGGNAEVAGLQRDQLQEVIGPDPEILSAQKSGNDQVLMRLKAITNVQKDELLEKLQRKYPEIAQLRFETVGPTLGKELLQKTVVAIVIVSIGIMAYVWYQFNSPKFGVSAIVAMFHDSFVLLGVFSILGKLFRIEVDVLFVTALLTTLSFSIHDTIVVFDRVRENQRKHPKADFTAIVDVSVLETLSRSLNNSMTIIMMLLALVLLGGESIRWFSLALLIGAITGTYSSTFTAAPLLVMWDRISKKNNYLRKL